MRNPGTALWEEEYCKLLPWTPTTKSNRWMKLCHINKFTFQSQSGRNLGQKSGSFSKFVSDQPERTRKRKEEEEEGLTWMSSDVKCPFMSLFFFLGGGGAGLWAGGRSVLLREWKDNMTLSTVRHRHSLRPSPSTALYNEKSCLHLPFSLFPWILIDLVLEALLRRQPFPLPFQRLSLERHCANESGL